MKKSTRFFLSISIFLLSVQCFAEAVQKNKIPLKTFDINSLRPVPTDSLKQFLLLAENDTVKSNIMIVIAVGLMASEPQEALDYAMQALAIEKKYDNKNRQALIYRKIGNIYLEAFTNYEKALEYYFKSLSLCEATGDNFSIAACYNNIGNIYFELKNGLIKYSFPHYKLFINIFVILLTAHKEGKFGRMKIVQTYTCTFVDVHCTKPAGAGHISLAISLRC